MTTAQLFAEALATLPVLLRAGAVWLVLLCGVAGLAVYAAAVAVWWVMRGMWRAARVAAGLRTHRTAPLAAEQPASDSLAATAAERRSEPRISAAPSWAQTEPHETEQAA